MSPAIELLATAEGGVCHPERVTLLAGQRMEPVSVGQEGDLYVTARGVALIAFHLFFDGDHLFAAAAAPGVRVAGRPLSRDWREVPVPAEISFGAARIAVRPAHAPKPPPPKNTPPKPPPPKPPPPKVEVADLPEPPRAPFPSGVTVVDDRLRLAVAANRAASALPPSIEVPSDEAPVEAPHAANGVDPRREKTRILARRGARSPLVTIAFRAALALASVVLVVDLASGSWKASPAPPRKSPAASSSVASAPPSASAPSAPPPPRAAPPAAAPLPAPALAKGQHGESTQRASAASRPRERSLEQRAVDAAASGAIREAAALYDALARATPDDPSYAAAARILMRRAAEQEAQQMQR